MPTKVVHIIMSVTFLLNFTKVKAKSNNASMTPKTIDTLIFIPIYKDKNTNKRITCVR